jgi:hypothetical protein
MWRKISARRRVLRNAFEARARLERSAQFGRTVVEPGIDTHSLSRLVSPSWLPLDRWLTRNEASFHRALNSIIDDLFVSENGETYLQGDRFKLKIPREFTNSRNVLINDFREIFLENVYGRYMPFGHLVNEGDIVLDCGANIGAFTLLAVTREKGVRVIAFEPHPRIRACLEENANINGLSNSITVIAECLSDHSGSVGLFFDESVFT